MAYGVVMKFSLYKLAAYFGRYLNVDLNSTRLINA